MTICAENRQHECQARMGGCLGYDCGHYLGRGEMKIKKCPNCEGKAKYYPNSDSQTAAIYCVDCPLGVEDTNMSREELVKIWNNLPRRDNPGHAPEGGGG